MLFDDRPEVTITLSIAQVFCLRDALNAAHFVYSEDWESVAHYVASHGDAHELEMQDAIHEMLVRESRPVINRTANELRALVEDGKARYQESLDEMNREDAGSGPEG